VLEIPFAVYRTSVRKTEEMQAVQEPITDATGTQSQAVPQHCLGKGDAGNFDMGAHTV
jgi:hypothetical protein